MDRRKFLRYGLTAGVVPMLLNGLPVKAFASFPFWQLPLGSLDNDRILVLVQLAGGNDGLNMVIPIDQYAQYQAARPNIAIAENKILSLQGNDITGLNPAMVGLQQLYNNGLLSIVQGVSYPQPSFSHFRATDIWLTGENADQELNTGWLGRYLDNLYPNFPENYPNTNMPDPFAIQIGSVVSPALQGPEYPMGMAISNPDSIFNLQLDTPPTNCSPLAAEQIAYITEVSDKTDAYALGIRNAAKKVTKQFDGYPDKGKNPLADQLKAVARLIAGGLRTKVYMVSLGGFDTHSKQTDDKDTSIGKHADLLGKLSEAITAFMADLRYLQVADRVMGITFSEFGRRIKSNASGGTDHGLAQPMLLFGNYVNPGVLGTNPILPANATANDNVAMQHDFRSIYASLLKDWFAVPTNELNKILLRDFPTLSVIRG